MELLAKFSCRVWLFVLVHNLLKLTFFLRLCFIICLKYKLRHCVFKNAKELRKNYTKFMILGSYFCRWQSNLYLKKSLRSCPYFVFLWLFHGLIFGPTGHSSLYNVHGGHPPLIVLDTSFSMAIIFIFSIYFPFRYDIPHEEKKNKTKPHIFQMYVSNVLELFCDPKEIFSVAICYLVLFLKWMSISPLLTSPFT